MNDYVVAILLGFSFGNLWLCALLVFSLQTTNRLTCGGYLLGRVLAIIVLALVVAGVGKMVTVGRDFLNILSGLLLIGFSVYLAATRMYGWVPPWKRPRVIEKQLSGESCDGECDSCPAHAHDDYAQACDACGDAKICAAEEPEVEALTREARTVWRRRVPEERFTGFAVGMSLGAMRGASMCSKLVVLVPILLHTSIMKAMGIGISFGLSSSIYPLLGFIFGAFAVKLVKYKRWLFGVSCVLLALAGLRYLTVGVMSMS